MCLRFVVVFRSCGVMWFLVVGSAFNFAAGDDDFSFVVGDLMAGGHV